MNLNLTCKLIISIYRRLHYTTAGLVRFRTIMSRSGIVPGGSSEEDERPSGRSNFEDWVSGLRGHLTTAPLRRPGEVRHNLTDSGIEVEQGQAVTSTPKRGIPRNARSNGGQQMGDPTPNQQSIPRRSQAPSTQGGAGPSIKEEPVHHFQRCRSELFRVILLVLGLHTIVVHTSCLWRSVPWR